MKVRFYGRLAELFPPELDVDTGDGCSVANIRERLAAKHPLAEKTLRRARACVADAIVDDLHVLRPDQSVEFLPPVSGG